MSQGALSPHQFAALYPPGRHDVPVEHLKALRDDDGRGRSGPRLDGVREGIKREGAILNPLAVVTGDHGASLVEGHHRHDAARDLGMTHVPVHVVDSYLKVRDIPRHPDTDRVWDETWGDRNRA